MEQYSATYANLNENFVLLNINQKDKIRDEYYPIFCIMKNILQRGYRTKPSRYLVEKLGKIVDIEKTIYMYSDDYNYWDDTIKGYDEHSDNPALDFYKRIIPKYLGEYAFIKGLIKPETLIDDIIEPVNKDFEEQCVDFYLPQSKLVIEIDGMQHINDVLQRRKDKARDDYLEKNNIKIIRIPVIDIKEENQNLVLKTKQIIKYISINDKIKEYKASSERTIFSDDELIRIKYDIILRLQILILSLLQKKVLTLLDDEWKFNIVTDISSELNINELLKFAVEDLYLWLQCICNLNRLKYKKPNIICSKVNDNNCISINFSISKRWTNKDIQDNNTIYVRNDYFDDKNYFSVSVSEPITYNLILSDNSTDVSDLLFILNNIFEHKDFRDGQLPIIINSLNRNDTIGILPTGSGKSLCYQISAILQPCVSFVVCPILSLMYDQKDNLDRLDFSRTNYISSDQNANEKENIMKDFYKGRYLFIWISPERFQSPTFRVSLQRLNENKDIALAVIDEVHCLSEWGHDFRISYLTLIHTVKNYCPAIRFLGLTATASSFVLEDLKKEFNIESFNIKSVYSMNRKELNFHLYKCNNNNKQDILFSIIDSLNKKYNGNLFLQQGDKSTSGLVFTPNATGKNGTEAISNLLANYYNTDVKYYHGKMKNNKTEVQNLYKTNKFNLLVATKSFGMGIDKGNIRYTIHYGLPWSIESFYQEAGRSGRDRNEADCYIIYKPETCDKKIIDELFSINVSVERISDLKENTCNDLSNLLYLWLQSNKGIERDLEVMRHIMNWLFKANDNIFVCSDKFKREEVEKALYRLYILGFISDWTMETWQATSAKITVLQKEYNEQIIENNLLLYIRRYEPEFSFNSDNERYNKYTTILKDSSLKVYTKYMKVLLTWTYDNIIYQRRMTIKNMMFLCDNYTTEAAFKDYIDSYFRLSDENMILDRVAFNPNDYNEWFEVFYDYIKEDEYNEIKHLKSFNDLSKIMASLQRYLESYRYNTGLNYLSGILRILCNQYSDNSVDGYERLTDAFNTIDGFSKEAFEMIFSKTLILVKNASVKNRNELGNFLIERYPQRAKDIYKELNDNSSLAYILKNNVTRINKILERIK